MSLNIHFFSCLVISVVDSKLRVSVCSFSIRSTNIVARNIFRSLSGVLVSQPLTFFTFSSSQIIQLTFKYVARLMEYNGILYWRGFSRNPLSLKCFNKTSFVEFVTIFARIALGDVHKVYYSFYDVCAVWKLSDILGESLLASTTFYLLSTAVFSGLLTVVFCFHRSKTL